MSFFQSVLRTIDNTFPTPRYLNFDPVAIDIAPKKIRLMKMRQKGDIIVPEIYKEIPLSKTYDLYAIDSIADINQQELKEVIDVLKSLKEEFDLSYVIVSLPEFKNYIFRMQLPAEARSDISSAILFSIEENVPLSAHDVNFDFMVINKEAADSEDVDLVVNVFPKKVINVYTKIMNLAGLEPISFRSESVAFADAVIENGDKTPYLLARILEDRINLAISEDGAVQYTSSIKIDMKKVLADYDSKEASELRETLNKILIFWFTDKNNKYQHQKIETALIAGDFAAAPGMQEFLERHLRINVELANVWVNCFESKDFIPSLNREESLKYVVASGMAQKGVRQS
jgi:Tfp pilus assembly PilM family ATPase